MTKIQQFLADLPEEKKSLFVPVFGSMEKFYTVVYLIARKSSCQRLEMGGISYVLLIVVLPPHDLDRMPEKAQLRKPKIDRKEQSGSQ